MRTGIAIVLLMAIYECMCASVPSSRVWEGKKYTLEESENFDEYMKALGVGWFMRKMGNAVSPTVEMIKDGDKYTMNTTSTFKSSSISFKIGEEFEEETVDGRTVKTKIFLDGENKFTQEQYGDKPSTIIREFKPDGWMIATFKINDIVCTRKYKLSS